MDKEATLNRCLWDVTHLSHLQCQIVGDQACGRRERVAVKGSIKGFQFPPESLRNVDLVALGNFSDYATSWEKHYSVLVDDRSASTDAIPVVDHKLFTFFTVPKVGRVSLYPVVAHYMTTHVSNIIVPRKFAVDDTQKSEGQLEFMLDRGMDAYVEEHYPKAGNWGPLSHGSNLGPNYFIVLTDPDGRIIGKLGAGGTEPGLESEDPLAYLSIAALSLKLATKGARVVFRMVTSRAARKIPVVPGVEVVSPVYRIAERDVVVVNTSAGRQAFYRSSGVNSGAAGKWFPVDEFRPYDGWFNKANYVHGPGLEKGEALHRLGTKEFARISEDLGNMSIPRGYVVPGSRFENAEMTLNRILDFFGARPTPATVVRPVPDPPVGVR